MKTLLLAAMLVVLPMQAEAVFKTGNDLVVDMREYEKVVAGQSEISEVSRVSTGIFIGYVIAAADGYEEAGVICTSNSVTIGQASEIVAAYLKAHPTDWHKFAISIVGHALKEAFPCG